MQKLHFSIVIHAPKEKVWDAMLSDKTYREWTEVFSPGSHFVGSWDQGADIQFLGPNDKGVMDGMVSRIKENRPYEYISIEHLGMIQDGKVDTTSEKVKKWAGALENYTFKEANGATQILVDMDSEEEYKEMFQDVWPKALQRLKEIVESENSASVTVEVLVKAPIEKVWKCWTEPDHVMHWNFASDEWESPRGENDLKVGGKFNYRMQAKDGSFGFDFSGEYTNVKEFELIEYKLGDHRKVKVQFEKAPDGIKVTEIFDIEHLNSRELQRSGWQAILDNFKKYAEK